jgi:hypothetical protein
MPEPSWEAGVAWAHGYLKFLDFQAAGYDVHVTFQKNKSVHVSVYVLETKTNPKLGQRSMDFGVEKLSLKDSSRLEIKTIVSPSSEISAEWWAFFEDRSTKKAIELNIIAITPVQVVQSTTGLSGVVAKGGDFGVPKSSTWGDKYKKDQYETKFPVVGKK